MAKPDLLSPSLVNTDMVRAHSIAALATLLISVVFGIIVSLQFLLPDLTQGSLVLGWGRLRYAHTQGIMLGWLGNAFIAFLYHAVPILTQRPVTSRRLGWILFGLWNFVAVIPGWILVLSGISQPLEWAEFPLIIDAFVIAAFVLAAIQFLPSFFRQGLDSLYVSSWYIIGGLVFTLLAYPMGNIVPELVSGATSAAFGGLWIHDAVGLFVTPMALSIIYFVIPASSGRPIYSHFLSMLGFWGLFFFYPLNGTHHYIFSVIPMAAQVGAIAASALLGVVVLMVVTNLFLSMRGSGFFPRDPGLRFISMSVVFYFLVSMQGASQAQMSLNQFVHFSDWVVGHSHLAMMGFATFASIGGIIHAWQRIPNAKYNARAIDISFWLLLGGITVMVVDLTIAGIIQARLWQQAVPWLESVQAAKPYWLIRNLSAIPVTAGFITLTYGLFSGPRGAGATAIQQLQQTQTQTQTAASMEPAPVLAKTSSSRGLSMSYLVASIAGVGFFAFSMVLLGLWPGKVLDTQIEAMSPASVLMLTPSEQRGRLIYAREGCAYCHTQQIRYIEPDIKRFGAPTLAWETQFDSPHLWGTRRIGPDLSREGSVRTTDWQYAHLFAPRSVVPLSIMPSYSALFDGSATQPDQEAKDLIAYIETLGRAREIAWPDGDRRAKEASLNNKWAQMSFDAPQLNAHPAKTQARGNAPSLAGVTAASNGKQLWLDNCSGCHGTEAKGDGLASTWLSPQPANLTEHQYSASYLTDVLWNGVEGSSMPAWRDQSPENLAALVEYVMELSIELSIETDIVQPSAEVIARGEQVFASHCTQCHGVNGDGNGFASAQLPILPVDFRGQRPTLGEGLSVLTNGMPGTPMAPWNDRLDNDEMLAVISYLRLFYEDEQSGATNDN